MFIVLIITTWNRELYEYFKIIVNNVFNNIVNIVNNVNNLRYI